MIKRIGMAFLTVLMFLSLSSYFPAASAKSSLDNTYYYLEEIYDNLLLTEQDLKRMKKHLKKKDKRSRNFLKRIDDKIKKLCLKHFKSEKAKDVAILEKYGLAGESVGIYFNKDSKGKENKSVLIIDYREKELYTWIDL